MWIYINYIWHETHCVNTTTIYDITLFMSVSVWSHPLYQWYNTHSIYDITYTVYIAQYALYMTSHTRFMTSQHSTHDIKAIISHLTPIISDSTLTVSLSSHPDYWSYNPHCMYDNTATICMTSFELRELQFLKILYTELKKNCNKNYDKIWNTV